MILPVIEKETTDQGFWGAWGKVKRMWHCPDICLLLWWIEDLHKSIQDTTNLQSFELINLASERYPHLRNFPLADFATANEYLDIDLLIGCDYYLSFIEGPPITGESPTAIPIKLGLFLMDQ